MSTIHTIADRLRRQGVEYEIERNRITAAPRRDNGFSVWLCEGDAEFIVGCEGWHQHFASEAEALDCFAFGLSGPCRLRVDLRGDVAYRWTLEFPTETGWQSAGSTKLLFFPFWRRRTVEYRQNVRDEGQDASELDGS
jgi:hypothetical protein